MRAVTTSRKRVRRLAVFTGVLALFTFLFLWPLGPNEPIGGGVSRISTEGSIGVFAPTVTYAQHVIVPWVIRVLPSGFGPDEASTPACIQDAWTTASIAHGGRAFGAWRVLDMASRDDVAVGDTYTNEPIGALSIKVPVAVAPVPPFALDDATGCSLGLAMALAFWDALDGGTLLDGRVVAATGAVDSAGHVTEIEGEKYKGAAVADAGIKVLFAAPADVDKLSASAGLSVTVIPVTEVSQAVQWLTSHPA